MKEKNDIINLGMVEGICKFIVFLKRYSGQDDPANQRQKHYESSERK